MPSKSLNCHFVSRFLTIPWEHGERMLWFYDFERDRLDTASSKHLFAREGTNTVEVERRLNRLVETPIASARTALWANGSDVSQDLEWSLFRALALLILLQPFRSSDSSDRSQTLEEVISRSDKDIDGLAHAIGATWRLMRITVSDRSPLVYPSSGFFPLLASPIGGKCAFAFAVPLSPIHAFVGVPSDIQSEQTEHWSANGAGFVSNYSVGYRASVVVVHPSLVNALPEAEIVKAIRDARAGVVKTIELCGQMALVLRKIEALI